MATVTEQSPPTGRATARGLIATIVPPVAWLVSLAASYVLQDFACSAYASAGAAAPDGSILVGLLAGNAVLLLVTVVAGVLGTLEYRREEGVRGFLGLIGLGSSVVFGLGIVLIAVNPLVLEVCP